MTLSGTQGPPQRRTSAFGRSVLAFALGVALVLLSPGLEPYRLLAAEFNSRGPVGPVTGLTLPQAPVGPASLPALPTSAIPALPASAIAGPASVATALPGAGAPAAAAAAKAPTAAEANAVKGASGMDVLRAGAEGAAKAAKVGDSAGVSGSLTSLFDGGKGGASEGAPVAGDAGKTAPALEKLSLDDLKAAARDSKREPKERQEAVKAIADRSGDPAKLALQELGTERGGGASDYEIKRLALRKLADKGTLLSLPPVSDEHAAEILASLSANKPELAAFDYDGTLEPRGQAASAETAQVLERLAASGTRTAILTDRSLQGRRAGDVGILDSLSTLSPAQHAAITVAANRGAEIVAFDAAGQKLSVEKAASWTEGEKAALAAAAQQTAWKYGSSLVDGSRTLLTDYDFAIFLPMGASEEVLNAAAESLKKTLADMKVQGAVVPRRTHADNDVPYITVSKYEKSHGAARLRKLRERFDRIVDAERLPAAIRSAARKLLTLLPEKAVDPKRTLVVGDNFFGPRGVDSGMAVGSPGALAIAVGDAADPRLDNVFLWNKKGHEASMELARAASAKAPPQMEGMNWKAFGGLFSARSASIIAFLGTTLAYAKVAIGAVGPSQFGTLAALGGLVSIAAGPLTGKIADKFSARTGMALNTILRAVFLLDLPLFSFFGVLNFWTLLLGAIANGWLLSSIMTTEGAYLRRLFGTKNLTTVNSLLQLNYFGLQIVFGLLLGIGKLVDGHNLMIPFYVASAVNAFVVLPITWKTMPKAAPGGQAAPAAAAEKKASKLSAVGAFFKQYWKEALILAGAIATFPLLHSALPITGALVWWITRTPGFKEIKKDKPVISGVALLSLGAFVFYAMQSFALPAIATALVGKAASSLMLGKMLGAVFLGQMISSSSMAKLPVVRPAFVGRIGIQRFVQTAVVGMAALWAATGLVPAATLAAAAATYGVAQGWLVAGLAAAGAAVATAMMAASHKFSHKAWVGLVGIGMGALALPALFWGSMPVLLSSLAVFGFFFGPASVALSSYVQRRAGKNSIGQVMGIQGSLFNAAISLGIGAVSGIAGLMHPMFPGALWALAALAAVAAVIFFFSSQKLPGLNPDQEKK